VVRVVLAVLGTVAMGWPLYHAAMPLDLRVYLAGGDALLHGHDLYGSGVQIHGYGFTYPPFAALPMAVLSALPGWLAEAITAAAFFAALAVVVQVCAPGLIRHIAESWSALVLLAAVLAGQPAWATLHDGQINMVLAALVLYDLRPGAPHTGRCGVLVGIAAGVKLTPAIFVIYLLARRRVADARNAALGFAGTVVLAALVAPGDSKEFWTDRLYETSRIGESERISNQSLMGLLLRATSGDQVAHVLWVPLAAATLALVLLVALRLSRAGDEVLALGVVGIGGCLLSPVSWTHHWVWFIPLLCGLVGSRYRGTRWGAALMATIAVVFVLGVNKPPMRATYGTAFGHAVLGNLFVLTALITIAVLAVSTVRAPIGESRPATDAAPTATPRGPT
jgi:alpha-1,2-mannosyltransferase